MDTLVRSFARIQKRQHRYLALSASSPSELHEYDLPLYKNGDSVLTGRELKRLLALAADGHGMEEEPYTRIRNLSEATLQEVNRDSLLKKLQTSFYRIKDPEERARVQDAVYQHLIGRRLRYEVPSFILNIMTSDLTARFRQAIKSAIQSGDVDLAAEEYSIDRFEIAFVLAKTRPRKNR